MSETFGARRCLPVGRWPAMDQTAWIAAHRPGGLLEDDGRAATWAAATSAIIAGGYGRFLSHVAKGEDLEGFAAPQDRITRARVEAYVSHLREHNHSSTVAARVAQLARAIGVMVPANDWAWLRRIARRLRRSATPARNDRARLLPATALFDLATSLIQRADTATTLALWRRALLFRDGLIVAILCSWAPRARNMAETSIGTNLQRRGEVWWVAFGSHETKNGRPIEVPLPLDLTEWIERYLDYYRPILARRSSMSPAEDALWISHRGLQLTAKEVGQRISAVTKRELGQDVNPHLFRKIIPTELAIHDPAHVGIAQPLLGHASYRTTEQAYNLGRALDAARRLHRTIQSLRAPTDREGIS